MSFSLEFRLEKAKRGGGVLSFQGCPQQVQGSQEGQNSTTRPGQNEGYGLLEMDYETIRPPWKVEQLQALQPILSDHSEKHV